MKSKVDKLNVHKLTSFPVDTRKLSDAVKKGVVKKTTYNDFAKKIKVIFLVELLRKQIMMLGLGILKIK